MYEGAETKHLLARLEYLQEHGRKHGCTISEKGEIAHIEGLLKERGYVAEGAKFELEWQERQLLEAVLGGIDVNALRHILKGTVSLDNELEETCKAVKKLHTRLLSAAEYE